MSDDKLSLNSPRIRQVYRAAASRVRQGPGAEPPIPSEGPSSHGPFRMQLVEVGARVDAQGVVEDGGMAQVTFRASPEVARELGAMLYKWVDLEVKVP